MKYIISTPNPASKYIEIEMQAENISADKIYFQLPAWRPGRYELGNFVKNIQRWKAFDEKGNELKFIKVTKDKWEVETRNIQKVFIRFNYFASQLDAGGCWLDNSQLYVNPVHCCMYMEGREKETCEVELKIAADWKVAGSLKQKSKNIFYAKDFDELVDSPFIASPSLQHHSYEVNKIPFHIWLQGDCTPDWNRIEKDFKAFTKEQINMLGDFPSAEYHFLIQVAPYKLYHGVEHLNSTVIAIGPGDELMTAQYAELVGVASHELFHVWNVKTIRPAEMLPYDYTKENYSQLGYVYEGFTTYYGDLILARSGFFNLEQYQKEISIRLQKHMDNYGRFNYSVAQSSFDTWLDGYVPGVPNRKTSIYDEGLLIALMLDLQIRNATDSKKSLDDVMRKLFNDFGKMKIGYSENDIISMCESVTKISFRSFFDNYVYKAVSYDLLLEELLSYAGLEIKKSPAEKNHERLFGFRTEKENAKIISVIPDSPAAVAGLTRGDEIILVNGVKMENNQDELFNQSGNNAVKIGVLTLKKERIVKLKSTGKTFYDCYGIMLNKKAGDKERKFIKAWCNF